MSLNPFRSFGSRGAALATAAVIGAGALLSNFPAAAQQTAFTPQQCENAVKIANAIVQRHKGEISNALIESFVRFSKSNCDLNTDWKLTGKGDEKVFGEFRVRLIALRTADAAKPQILAKQ